MKVSVAVSRLDFTIAVQRRLEGIAARTRQEPHPIPYRLPQPSSQSATNRQNEADRK